MGDDQDYILPARFDDTEVPGLLSSTAYIDLKKYSPEEVANLVIEKIGISQLKGISAPQAEALVNYMTARRDFLQHRTEEHMLKLREAYERLTGNMTDEELHTFLYAISSENTE